MSSNDSNTTYFYLSERGIEPLFPCNTLLTAPILILDILAISYYFKQRTKFVPAMYVLVSASDVTMSLGILVQSFLLFLKDTMLEHDTLYFCLLLATMAVSNLAYRSSLFINVVLSVGRTVNIINPFYKIQLRCALISVLINILVWGSLAGFDSADILTQCVPLTRPR